VKILWIFAPTVLGRSTWRDAGGKSSSAAVYDGKLYVTASPGVQEQIKDFLALMRKKD